LAWLYKGAFGKHVLFSAAAAVAALACFIFVLPMPLPLLLSHSCSGLGCCFGLLAW
jgi:hypothetical protein